MREQQFEFGEKGRPWPRDGEGNPGGVLQVYIPVRLSENPDLKQKLGLCREALRDAPLELVDDEFLHVTVDLFADVEADRISEAERDEVVADLRAEAADIPVYDGTVYWPVARGGSVLMPIWPLAPLLDVQRRARNVIRARRGEHAVTWRQPDPHISIAFAREATDSDQCNPELMHIRSAKHAPLRLSEMLLVDVRPDLATKRLQWTPASEPIPFAGPQFDGG